MPAKSWKRVSSHAPPPQTRQRQRRAGPAPRWLVDNPRLLPSCWLRIVGWVFDDRGKDQIILGGRLGSKVSEERPLSANSGHSEAL